MNIVGCGAIGGGLGSDGADNVNDEDGGGRCEDGAGGATMKMRRLFLLIFP